MFPVDDFVLICQRSDEMLGIDIYLSIVTFEADLTAATTYFLSFDQVSMEVSGMIWSTKRILST